MKQKQARTTKVLVIAVFAVALLAITSSVSAACQWRCERGYDTATCEENALLFGALTCTERVNCELVGFRQIGDYWVPVYECAVVCEMEYCTWT